VFYFPLTSLSTKLKCAVLPLLSSGRASLHFDWYSFTILRTVGEELEWAQASSYLQKVCTWEICFRSGFSTANPFRTI